MELIFKRHNRFYYEAFIKDKNIAHIVMDDTGSFYIWLSPNNGCWSAWVLKALADKCDQLNAD